MLNNRPMINNSRQIEGLDFLLNSRIKPKDTASFRTGELLSVTILMLLRVSKRNVRYNLMQCNYIVDVD